MISGLVYNGDDLPRLRGQYFYSDWCSGAVWRMVKRGIALLRPVDGVLCHVYPGDHEVATQTVTVPHQHTPVW